MEEERRSPPSHSDFFLSMYKASWYVTKKEKGKQEVVFQDSTIQTIQQVSIITSVWKIPETSAVRQPVEGRQRVRDHSRRW